MAGQLDPLTLGLVLAVLGMGGTLLTLFVLSLVVDLLKRLFPLEGPGVGGQESGQNRQIAAQPEASTVAANQSKTVNSSPPGPRPPAPGPR